MKKVNDFLLSKEAGLVTSDFSYVTKLDFVGDISKPGCRIFYESIGIRRFCGYTTKVTSDVAELETTKVFDPHAVQLIEYTASARWIGFDYRTPIHKAEIVYASDLKFVKTPKFWELLDKEEEKKLQVTLLFSVCNGKANLELADDGFCILTAKIQK